MKRVRRRLITIMPAVLLQIIWIVWSYRFLAPYSAIVNTVLSILAVILVIYISAKHDEGAYRVLWLIIILSFPIPGTFLYICFGNGKTARPLKRKLTRAESKLPPLSQNHDCEILRKEAPRLYQTFLLTAKSAHSVITPCGETVYYSLGEDMWNDMLCELKNAKRFIFAEYFILAEGVMLDEIVKIMAQKAREGVDVRVMYDDLGSISTYSRENVKKLHSLGIKCIPFNPLLFVRGTLNNRDHRKMLIIDGKTAFSGGINLADEYINRLNRFGHWKDIGFKLTGDGVSSFTRMFCGFWNAFAPQKIDAGIFDGLYDQNRETTRVENGCALTYCDSPFSENAVSCELYIELLSQAQHSAWFYTPYLMLGNSLADAFIRAAKRGVDVRLILPAIPDKKLVFRMTQSYYGMLLDAGVKLYEYTPGFVHAKAALIDDTVGTLGTVNLDYRSLYLHFENNTLFYKASVLDDLKKDFLKTQEQCHEIVRNDKSLRFLRRMVDSVMRIFAPLC